MSMEKNSVLEELEKEFEQSVKSGDNINKTRKRSKITSNQGFLLWIKQRRKVLSGVLILLVIAFSVLAGRHFLKGKNPSEIKNGMPAFLTESEKEDWNNKEVDFNEIYIYVNTNLNIEDGNKIQLRLANPPYCAYPIKISIQDEAKGEVYYTSGILKPGESLEEVELSKVPEQSGNYPVTIVYTFYDSKSKDTVVGEHAVSAELIK